MAEGGVEEESGEMLGPATVPVHQSSPILNAKSEESDCESTAESPEPATTMGMDGNTGLLLGQKLFQTHAEDTKITPSTQNTPPQFNGSLTGLNTLHNLQSLANLQQTFPQVASLAANLQNNMSNLVPNAPLNLTVAPPRSTPSGTIEPQSITSNGISTPTTPSAIPPLLTTQQPAPMPQFILASGQLVQGIQGAQLLIPTSQGLATQTILTIPVNHVNSSDQMVNLALNNGQVVTTSLANLQAMAHSNLFNATSSTAPTNHLFPNGSTQQLLQSLPQMLNNPHQTNPPLINTMNQPLLSTAPSLLPTAPTPSTATAQSQPNLSQRTTSHYPESKLHPQSLTRNSSPTGCNGVNRLPTNGELTITTTHAPVSSQGVKRSPASLSPNDNSSSDLLIDSPNQPTINQTNSNVVDGINLDEIKDFAKAFKLRRLSLGLTQTQVGQALSVTEGPAYSQSAICSALASQMFAAAQLSSQQQAMFEKLDITPKSAQKIKPVLERWMKEAEERYKSGQNHLTDFIGIEPSKKRKRRTSFTPQALELLNAHFERNTHPSGTEITGLAHQLGYEREVIRIWFCNKRQALKNTVRMMSKGMV